jgi:DNA-binding transcriptional LysR family regulator
MAPLPHPLATAPAAAWAGVEHRHLASLSAVARTRSFRGAAGTLGYSQSALSQQIGQLERLLGVSVANRRRGSSDVTLTPAGEAVLRRADPILAVHRAAQADMAAMAAGGERLRLGVAEHLGLGLASAMLAAFLQHHPGAEVELVRDADGSRLLDGLAQGRLDAVLADPPRHEDPSLATELLTPEDYVVLAPVSWSVVRRPDAPVAELLANLPVAVDVDDPDLPRVLDDLRAAGVELAEATRVRGADALRVQVASGAAAVLLPAGAVAPGDPDVLALPLAGLVGPRAVGVMWQKSRRHAPLVASFVATALRDRGRADGARRASLPAAVALPPAADALAARWDSTDAASAR